jgi:hypothetical protein
MAGLVPVLGGLPLYFLSEDANTVINNLLRNPASIGSVDELNKILTALLKKEREIQAQCSERKCSACHYKMAFINGDFVERSEHKNNCQKKKGEARCLRDCCGCLRHREDRSSSECATEDPHTPSRDDHGEDSSPGARPRPRLGRGPRVSAVPPALPLRSLLAMEERIAHERRRAFTFRGRAEQEG